MLLGTDSEGESTVNVSCASSWAPLTDDTKIPFSVIQLCGTTVILHRTFVVNIYRCSGFGPNGIDLPSGSHRFSIHFL